jgi:hypothetical protein
MRNWCRIERPPAIGIHIIRSAIIPLQYLCLNSAIAH